MAGETDDGKVTTCAGLAGLVDVFSGSGPIWNACVKAAVETGAAHRTMHRTGVLHHQVAAVVPNTRSSSGRMRKTAVASGQRWIC